MDTRSESPAQAQGSAAAPVSSATIFSLLAYAAIAAQRTVTTVYCTVISRYDIFNQVADGLFLGRLPTKEVAFDWKEHGTNLHLKIIDSAKKLNPDRPLGLVFSVVEPEELEGVGFYGSSIVSPNDWKGADKTINHQLVVIKDKTVDVKDDKLVVEAILNMRKHIKANQAVYVHCKAGKSRSASMMLIYLMLYGPDPLKPTEMSFDDALKFLREKRPQIELNEGNFTLVKRIVAMISESDKKDVSERKQAKDLAEEKKDDDIKKDVGANAGGPRC